MGDFLVAVIASGVAATLTAAGAPMARLIIGRLREHRAFATKVSKAAAAAGCVSLFVAVGWVLHQLLVRLLVWLGAMVVATPAEQPEGLLSRQDLGRFLASAERWQWQVVAALMVAVAVFGSFRELGHPGGRLSGWVKWSAAIRAVLLGGLMTLVWVVPVALVTGLHLAVDWAMSAPSLADYPPPPGLGQWSLPWSVYWSILTVAAVWGACLLYGAIDLMFRLDDGAGPARSDA